MLESMKEIISAEQEAARIVAAAQAEAKQIVRDANDAGLEKLNATWRQVGEENKAKLEEAQKMGQGLAAKKAEQARDDAATLVAEAARHMEAAVSTILGKVVD